MTNQGPLVHVPDRAELWPRLLLPGGDVHGPAWRDALASKSAVGTCRGCGGYLWPAAQYRLQLVDWFPAECKPPTGCGRELAHHGPRPAAKKLPRERY